MVTSPLPSSLAGECRKAASILNSFIDPGEGLDVIIPPTILSKAKGLAIFTVLKAGFIFSGRAGSGLVIARLPDGSWSAPSAIGTLGAGFGGQIGAELTEFVIVLNTKEAVKAFSQSGNITLGGNLSVAVGPVGRNAEAAGVAALTQVAAIYSYSKTKGLFAGVSLEGSVIITRHPDNVKMYRQEVTAKQLLNGSIPPPEQAQVLYRALDAKFGGSSTMYNDQPVYGDQYEDSNSRGERFVPRQQSYQGTTPRSDSAYPGLDKAPREKNSARAMYDFAGEQKGDLSFKRGDIIHIVKRTSSQNDWWTGRIGDREGTFPANFVDLY
ncbi:hypothetical protein K450DRAFT_235151 [Umbelopsis ramanniana AG]|uniref:SH3 domain-containing protein n=1 Tax=Umbelopsis ramanniana AG TaxID=1314678 RepID=A0AAD5HF98_UMBRA|nr:uncharacterized protein K450DRAFT_235151 [Umbelopsis ramanniana AG]KAI8580904.1 hypothetical protein K450DRAFT_235151 [Umbelopsis ramanniana AG]